MPEYEETYAALVKGNEVVNTIVIDPKDNEFIEVLHEEYDRVEIVGERDRPSPGWLWDGTDWTHPPDPELEPEPEPSPEQVAAESMVEDARATLKDPKAPRPERQQAATFLRSMGAI